MLGLAALVLAAAASPADSSSALASSSPWWDKLVFTLSGALPGRWWLLPLTLLPVTIPLAVVAYRSLGHTTGGDYLMIRTGALNRRTVALQKRAVIGWTIRSSR